MHSRSHDFLNLFHSIALTKVHDDINGLGRGRGGGGKGSRALAAHEKDFFAS